MATTRAERDAERDTIRKEVMAIRDNTDDGRAGRSVDRRCLELAVLQVRAQLNTAETVEAGLKKEKPPKDPKPPKD